MVFKGAGFVIPDSPFPAGRFRSVLYSRAACSVWKKILHPRRGESAAPKVEKDPLRDSSAPKQSGPQNDIFHFVVSGNDGLGALCLSF